jgi:hypothetical protein
LYYNGSCHFIIAVKRFILLVLKKNFVNIKKSVFILKLFLNKISCIIPAAKGGGDIYSGSIIEKKF